MKDHASLLRRRRQLVHSLPPLAEIVRGSFFVRRRRCGARGCHCRSGPGHRTAYISVTFKDGSTEQISLPRDLEPLARRWVRNYQRWWKAIEDISHINRRLLKQRWVDPES